MSEFDYIVRDSSLLPSRYSTAAENNRDTSIRIGIVRSVDETEEGLVYTVEVAFANKMILVGCRLMTRWGGPHNFEEYGIRPWLHTAATAIPAQLALATYSTRPGDVVVVCFIAGRATEGIILGGLGHASRKPKLSKGNTSYLSEFNGLETSIKEDGTYKVTFKGYSAINEANLKTPPKGISVLPPIYNKLTGGSYFGFKDDGSYVASDGTQAIKIYRNLLKGSIILQSGNAKIELGGIQKNLSATGNQVVIESTVKTSIKSGALLNLQSKVASIKSDFLAIGNDRFELMDGLVQLIDALGTLVITSPLGTCLPLNTAPTWNTSILPLKLKISSIKGSLQDADSFSLSGDDDSSIPSSAD